MKKKFLIVGMVVLVGGLAVSLATADSVSGLVPVSDGNYQQWTPSTGTTHYTLVDESSCNGTTDYVSTTVVGRRDSYGVNLSGIHDNSTITSIAITPCASKNSNGGGSSTLNVFYRFEGTNSSNAGNYSLNGTTPTTLSATTFSGLSLVKTSTSTLEIGAVLSAGTKGARLSRIATTITYTQPAPTAPSDLSAVASSSMSAYLTWSDNSDNETQFKIERSVDNLNFGQISSVSANKIHYSNTGLSAGTYYYRVRASNGGGNSDYSNTATVTIP